MISDKVIDLTDSYGVLDYPHKNGHFLFINKSRVTYAHKCREVIASYQRSGRLKRDSLGFFKPNLNLNGLDAFFTAIEKKLELKENTIFHHTSLDNIIQIDISKFWLADETKFQLFTLFLRAGAAYNRGTVSKTLRAYPLARRSVGVSKAINYFLKGNVNATNPGWKRENFDHYRHSQNGFVDKFTGVSTKFIKENLVKNI